MSDTIHEVECWISGHVQGVGFRYKTVQIAKGFEVTGMVENLADGRVHLVAEGDEEEALAFCEEVERQLSPFIREVRRDVRQTPRAYTGFVIAG